MSAFASRPAAIKDTDPDLIELQKGGSTNPESVRIVQGSSIVELPNKLFFAQFADGNFGDTTLSSQIVLVNPSDLVTAEVRIILNLGSGAPFQVDLNGEVVEGLLELMIPPGNTVIFATDGLGDIRQGSVTVCSNIKLVGVVLFSGSLGFAGVGSGSPLREAIAPVLAETGAGVNTGIAVMALGQEVTIRVTLLDAAGNVLASASVELSSLGQDALLVTDFVGCGGPGFLRFPRVGSPLRHGRVRRHRDPRPTGAVRDAPGGVVPTVSSWMRAPGRGPILAVALILLLAAPMVGVLLIGLVRSILIPRILIWTTIPFYLMIAAGILSLKQRWLQGLVFSVVVGLHLWGLAHYYTSYRKEAWHKAARFVARQVVGRFDSDPRGAGEGALSLLFSQL